MSREDVYKKLFIIADEDKDGIISGREAISFFSKSGIDTTTLGQMWEFVSKGAPGLNPAQFFTALNMISLIQAGKHPTQGVVDESVGLPVFEGIQLNSGGGGSGQSSSGSSFVWAITSELRESYVTYFNKLDQDGDSLITANEAFLFFSKSNLPKDVLANVWKLSDIGGDGNLDINEFSIALFLVHAIQAGKQIPMPLPDTLIQSAFPNVNRNTTNTPPPVLEEEIVDNSPPEKEVDLSSINWSISDEETNQFERIFSALDINLDNSISTEEARELFENSSLGKRELAKIYELADVNKDTSLSRKEFFIAMKLVALRSNGIPLPDECPEELYHSVGLEKPKKKTINIPSPQSVVEIPKPVVEEHDQEKVQEAMVEIEELEQKIEALIPMNIKLSSNLESARREKKQTELEMNSGKSEKVKLISEIRNKDAAIKRLNETLFGLSGKLIRKEAQLGVQSKQSGTTGLSNTLKEILANIEQKEQELIQVLELLEQQAQDDLEEPEVEEALQFVITKNSSSSSDDIINPFATANPESSDDNTNPFLTF